MGSPCLDTWPLPEHVYLLIGESTEGNPFKVPQVLKQEVSRSLREDAISTVPALHKEGVRETGIHA